MRILIQLTIFSDIALSSVYLITYAITLERIFSVLTVASLVLSAKMIRPLRPSTRKVMAVAGSVILFKFIVDSTIHLQDLLDPFKLSLIEIFTVLLLPLVEWSKIPMRQVRTAFFFAAGAAMFFGFLQTFGIDITLKEMIPTNQIFIFEKQRFDYLEHTGRIVGTYTTGVSFSLMLGTLFFVLMGLLRRQADILRFFIKNSMVVAGLVIIFFLILHTQTRSAIYGVPLALMVGYFLSSRRFLRKTVIAFVSLAFAISLFGVFQALVIGVSERAAFGMDANTYYKVTSNIYGAYAALSHDPLFGVPVNRRLDRGEGTSDDMALVKEGRQLLGDIIETDEEYRLAATNHNQFAYFLKYYGLVGFFMFLWLLFVIFKKISQKANVSERFVLMSIFIFHVQFSMLHNNQLLQTLLVWIFLGLGDEDGSNKRRNVNIQ